MDAGAGLQAVHMGLQGALLRRAQGRRRAWVTPILALTLALILAPTLALALALALTLTSAPK